MGEMMLNSSLSHDGLTSIGKDQVFVVILLNTSYPPMRPASLTGQGWRSFIPLGQSTSIGTT